MVLLSAQEFGAYEEFGVIIIGFRFERGPLEYVMLQAPTPRATVELEEDARVYSEISGQEGGAFDAMSTFAFHPKRRAVTLTLHHGEQLDLTIRLPDDVAAEEMALLWEFQSLVEQRA